MIAKRTRLKSLFHAVLASFEIAVCQIPVRCTTKPRNLRHLLLQNGVLASLTNDQICPLHNNDTDKEGGVTSVFKNFSLTVGLQGKQTAQIIIIRDSTQS